MTRFSVLLGLLRGTDEISTALNDSIATGSINAIEVPYRLVIQNWGLAGSAAQQAIGAFVDLIREIAARGCPVEIRLEQNG